jgi:Fe-Mn family superoxide dismutase
VDKVNQIVKGTSYAHASLEQIIAQTRGQADTEPLFNNAAQVFNHTFYWNSMKPGGGGRPAGSMAEKIDTAFGGYDKFAEAFSHAAASQFGSGWAWLVKAEDNLKIITTGNASTPAGTDLTPLLTLDVWEHAYYLDYQNRRTEYIKAFLEHLVNWEFAEKNMG